MINSANNVIDAVGVDVALSRMSSRLPFSNHNAIESSTSSANAETASMTDASNLGVGG